MFYTDGSFLFSCSYAHLDYSQSVLIHISTLLPPPSVAPCDSGHPALGPRAADTVPIFSLELRPAPARSAPLRAEWELFWERGPLVAAAASWTSFSEQIAESGDGHSRSTFVCTLIGKKPVTDTQRRTKFVALFRQDLHAFGRLNSVSVCLMGACSSDVVKAFLFIVLGRSCTVQMVFRRCNPTL